MHWETPKEHSVTDTFSLLGLKQIHCMIKLYGILKENSPWNLHSFVLNSLSMWKVGKKVKIWVCSGWIRSIAWQNSIGIHRKQSLKSTQLETFYHSFHVVELWSSWRQLGILASIFPRVCLYFNMRSHGGQRGVPVQFQCHYPAAFPYFLSIHSICYFYSNIFALQELGMYTLPKKSPL